MGWPYDAGKHERVLPVSVSDVDLIGVPDAFLYSQRLVSPRADVTPANLVPEGWDSPRTWSHFEVYRLTGRYSVPELRPQPSAHRLNPLNVLRTVLCPLGLRLPLAAAPRFPDVAD